MVKAKATGKAVTQATLDATLKRELERFPTKDDLKRELSQFVTLERFDSTTRALLEAIEANRQAIEANQQAIGSLRRELNEDLARHINTMSDVVLGWITAVDDRYRTCPSASRSSKTSPAAEKVDLHEARPQMYVCISRRRDPRTRMQSRWRASRSVSAARWGRSCCAVDPASVRPTCFTRRHLFLRRCPDSRVKLVTARSLLECHFDACRNATLDAGKRSLAAVDGLFIDAFEDMRNPSARELLFGLVRSLVRRGRPVLLATNEPVAARLGDASVVWIRTPSIDQRVVARRRTARSRRRSVAAVEVRRIARAHETIPEACGALDRALLLTG
jgi:hypothetical protein